MPELPEVETIRRDLQSLIVGRKILGITTNTPKQVKPSLVRVKKAVVGAKVKNISRKAKIIQIFLDNGKILLVHLKLTGRLLVRDKGEPKDNWQRVVIGLSGDKELRFSDLRKFGWIKLVGEKELQEILSEFGLEPLDDLRLDEFKKILSSTKRAVKIVLLDQKKIAGIGNIYAVDALNLAKIDPRRPANSLSKEEAVSLLRAIEKVLKAGIRLRGASDQYYLDALGHKGQYQDHFLVYNRKGSACYNCKGRIEKLKLAGRGTYFCPKCQR